jgi:hypothetical protein
MISAILLRITERRRKTDVPTASEMVLTGPMTINRRRGSCIKNKGNERALNDVKQGSLCKRSLVPLRKSWLMNRATRTPNPNSNILLSGNHSMGSPENIFDSPIRVLDVTLARKRREMQIQGDFLHPQEITG